MTLMYKKLGREEGIVSATLDSDKPVVEEQSPVNRVPEYDSIAIADIASVGQAGIARLLTPAMIIGQTAAAPEPFTAPAAGMSSLASIASEERAAALKSVFGIWKDRQDVPEDGLAYQQEMRVEWR